jgi:hypothetical protein
MFVEMNGLSRRAKVTITLLTACGVLIYALVVEYGINAGKVHYGVDVAGFAIGGKTLQDAVTALHRRRSLLRSGRLCFARHELELCVPASRVGRLPDAAKVADAAYSVGRSRGPVGNILARIGAYTDGDSIHWRPKLRKHKVRRLLDRWERQLADAGLGLDRPRMRAKLRRALTAYPRRAFRIPLER